MYSEEIEFHGEKGRIPLWNVYCICLFQKKNKLISLRGFTEFLKSSSVWKVMFFSKYVQIFEHLTMARNTVYTETFVQTLLKNTLL